MPAQLKLDWFTSNSQGISNSYDGFGQPLTAASSMGGVARSIAYTHDSNGNRTSVRADSGHALYYAYDGLDRVTRVEEAGGYVVARIGYDSAGRRSSLAFGPGGAVTSSGAYGYESGRLKSLGFDLAGTASDQNLAFAYNPASQVASRTSANPAYAAAPASLSRGYSANGLNQYQVVDGVPQRHVRHRHPPPRSLVRHDDDKLWRARAGRSARSSGTG